MAHTSLAYFRRPELGVVLVLALLTLLYGGALPMAPMALAAAACLLWAFIPPAKPAPLAVWLKLGLVLPVGAVLVYAAHFLLPASLVLWGDASLWAEAPQTPAWPAASVAPFNTLVQLLAAGGYALVGVVVYRLGRHGSGADLLLKGAVAVTTLSCIYAVVMFATGNGYVLGWEKTVYQYAMTGPFVYPNAFAAFTGLGMLGALALMLERVGEVSGRLPFGQRFKAFYWLVLRPRAWVAALWFLGFACLVMSGSRAGLVTVLAGHVAFFFSLIIAKRGPRFPLLGILTGVLVLVILFLSMAGDTLGRRYSRLIDQVDGRATIHAVTTRMIADSPLAGTGLGTFEALFPMAKLPEPDWAVQGTTEHAHSVYLETAAELGIPATLLLGVAVTVALALCLNGLGVRRRAVVWPALGVGVFVQVGLHSLFDFILALPAIALLALLLVGVGVAQSLPPKKEGEGAPAALPTVVPGPAPVARWARPVLPVVLLAVAGAGASLWLGLAAWQLNAARPVLAALTRGDDVLLPELEQADAALAHCLKLVPFQAACAEGAAQVALAEAAKGFPGAPATKAALRQALGKIDAALAMAPANGSLWFRKAQVHALLGDNEAGADAMVQSVLLAPLERPLDVRRVPLMLRLWTLYTPDDRALLQTHLQTLAASRKRAMVREIFKAYPAPVAPALYVRLKSIIPLQ